MPLASAIEMPRIVSRQKWKNDFTIHPMVRRVF